MADETTDLPFIVGAGASAGGLEALSTMLDGCPAQSGLALIVVQHLSPDYKSLMPELLNRHIDMKVVHADDDTVPVPNTVYVIRPQTELTFKDGRIRVSPLVKEHGRLSLPINTLFESLAAERKGECALVVLSGTGSDGALGLRSGKQAGAVTVAQSPETARFDGMPRSAIATGMVDLVLGPRDVLQQLAEMRLEGKNAYFSSSSGKFELVLPRVLSAVKNHTGVDFSHYKIGTIARRVQRRMRQLEISDLRDYADLVRREPVEAQHIRNELLIGVTRFLRDEGAIEAVRSMAIPRLLATTQGPLRLWVPGCSTGQEAYSLAVMLQEAIDLSGEHRTFKLFATDVDELAIEQASQGEFTLDMGEQLPDNLRDRYFIRRGDRYVVTKSLREKLLFSRHDLLQDPPFSRIDMASCRNLLIYFKTPAQERALRLLSNSLRDQGLLWLGASESVGNCADLFEVIDGRWKIFLARPSRKRAAIAPLRTRGPDSGGEERRPKPPDRVRVLLEELQSAYVPPCLVVDENLRLLYRFGDLDKLMHLPSGVVSLDVRDFLPEEMSGLLSTVVGRLRENNEALYREMRVDAPRGAFRFNLRVRRINLDGSSHMVALFFEEIYDTKEEPGSVSVDDMSADTHDRMKMLEQELRLSRENLQATVEELESSNEELQATNEELVAANEELQSTNEELQSVNEELHTVNAEHSEKLTELGLLNADLDNLFSSVDIGILFLDSNLTIRRFNGTVGRYFHILDHDEGRPLAHLSHRLDYNELLDDCARVLREGRSMFRRTRADDEIVMVRITPHASKLYGVQGVVVTLTDITLVEDAERQVEQLSAAFHHSPASICVIERSGKVLHLNPAFESRSGHKANVSRGTLWTDLMPESERDRGREILANVHKGVAYRGVLRMRASDGREYFELGRLSRTSERTDSVVHIGELLSTRFVAYDQARQRGEPASIGRPSYNVWSADSRFQVLDAHVHELLGLATNKDLNLAAPETFAAADDIPSLQEFFSTPITRRSAIGYSFHTANGEDRRRILMRFGGLRDNSGEVGGRALVEFSELPEGPSGFRNG